MTQTSPPVSPAAFCHPSSVTRTLTPNPSAGKPGRNRTTAFPTSGAPRSAPAFPTALSPPSRPFSPRPSPYVDGPCRKRRRTAHHSYRHLTRGRRRRPRRPRFDPRHSTTLGGLGAANAAEGADVRQLTFHGELSLLPFIPDLQAGAWLPIEYRLARDNVWIADKGRRSPHPVVRSSHGTEGSYHIRR
jgi:hypothetical protein